MLCLMLVKSVQIFQENILIDYVVRREFLKSVREYYLLLRIVT
jgi:hypothetical protein